MIAVNTEITSSRLKVNAVTDAEILWIKVHCQGHKDILIAACYRPDVSDKVTSVELRESLTELSTNRKRAFGIIVGGDFNYPGWNWEDNIIKPGTQYVGLHQEFGDILDDFGLTQHITEPTRIKNTLDLVATNMPEQVNNSRVIPGISDHAIAYLELSVKPIKKTQPTRKVFLYNKADWTEMKKFLIPRLERLELAYIPSPDDLWTNIKLLIQEATDTYIPKRKTKKKDSCPWIDKELHGIMKKRDKLLQRCKRKGNTKVEKRYLLYRRTAQYQFRKKHTAYVHRLFTDEQVNKETRSKRFWTYVKHRRSNAVENIGALRDGLKLVTAAAEKANLLNKQFVSVFSKTSTKTLLEPKVNSLMRDITITQEGVAKQLKQLDPYKAAGPDNISPRVLKELADVLAPSLTSLFQLSLDKAVVPKDWKKAIICPAFKKGERHQASNYRPISLTCVTSKVLEHIVTSQIMSFAEEEKLLFENQHGFRKNRGCERQLVEFVTDVSKRLDEGKETEACIMDFSKAFDKVNHQKLITKLQDRGICYQVCAWIEDFLCDRSQQVAVEGNLSETAHVTSGVPQGSVVGPTLFLFYIDDLPQGLDSTVRLFADDTIVYNTTDNINELQKDLRSLEKWEENWDMEFHPAKCQHISFSRRKSPSQQHLTLHNLEIPKADDVKYLGVTVDSKLRWHKHLSNIAAKGNSTLGFIRRNVTTTSEEVKSLAYKQLVRPVLEYASSAWDSLTQTQETSLEAVQRRAARLVCGIRRTDRKTSVSGLVQRLGWEKLDERRKSRRLQLFRQMHFSESNIITQHIQKASHHSSRKHCQQYFLPHVRTQHHQRSFFMKTAKDWNALPLSSPLLVAPG